MVDGGALLLDVREDEEWVAGHAPLASHIPMGLLATRLAEVPQGRTVVCVCRSGHRSGVVAAALLAEGYDANNLAGGMQAWAMADLPVVTANGGSGVIL